MASLKEFFNHPERADEKGVTQKNNLLKKNIIAYMAVNGEATLADLSKTLHVSIPTVTKLVDELVEEEIVTDNGKIETTGGRRPNIFGLQNTAIYFAGVDVCRDQVVCLVTDLQNNVIMTKTYPDFELEDSDTCLESICSITEDFLSNCGIDRSKLLGVGICIAGRVNPKTGRSYKYFTSHPESLSAMIEKKLGHPVLIENDTRARCYAEFSKGCLDGKKNVIYLNLGRGVAIGIVLDGKLYYGKSGFAGEFGHIPFFDNEIICGCGKKGCLETEVSGIALENKMALQIQKGQTTVLQNRYRERGRVHITEIIEAAQKDDTLSIELIEEAGEKVGKSIAFLINIFNPELVIIGGHLAHAGDYVMLPLKSAVNKYSLSLVYNDTEFRTSSLGDSTGSLGAAMLIRNKIIGI